MSLYNARLTPDPATLTVTKFDALGNPEASYLTSEEACTCPAGMRPVCRHRTMLPNLRPIADTHWFYDYERHDVVDLNGMTKATHDRIALREHMNAVANLQAQAVQTPDRKWFSFEEQATQSHPHPEPATTEQLDQLQFGRVLHQRPEPAPTRMRR